MTFGSKTDAERQKKRANQAGTSVITNIFFVNINKCLKPIFLELYII